MRLLNGFKLTVVATVLATGYARAEMKDKSAMPDAAAMAQMQKLTMPGPNHQILQGLVGTWTVSSKMWMKPGTEPQVSQGTSVNTLIFGGRFLKQDYKGTAMGQPFEGVGYYGYDNVKGDYVSVWLDNFVTGIMTSNGHYDATAKTLTDSGTMSCPMTGDKNLAYRTTWKMTDNDHSVFTMYSKGPDGQETKNMELTYTRAK